MYKLEQQDHNPQMPAGEDDDNQKEPSRITEEMILYYTDCRKLSDVQVVALRERNLYQGMDMLSMCQQLQVAFLQNNHLTTDLHHLAKMSKLVKLNLSFNQIVTLPGKEILSGLKSLRILFLDHNLLQKWKNLESLTAIPTLYHLTLLNNPVVQTPGYRHFLVTKLPGLLALDDYIITDEERMEDVGHGIRFKALSQFMRLYAPDFKEGLTAEQHLFQVDLEIYKLRRLYEKNSPSIRIQALFKGYKRRVAHTNYFQKRQKSIIYIQKMVRGWLQRLRVRRELRAIMIEQGLEYLVMTQDELQIHQAKQKLKGPMLAYIWRMRVRKLRNMMALKIQRMWRMYKEREYSFIRGLEIDKYPVVYFLREQRIRFQEILNQTCRKLKGAFQTADLLKNFVSQGSEFYTLRYPDYTETPYRMMPLLHLTMPSALSKVMPNRSSKLFPQTQRSIKHLMCQYGRDRGAGDLEKLQKLQPRHCGVDYEMMIEEVKQRRPLYDKYEDFDTLFIPNIKFLKALVQVVKEHNMMSQGKQILIFFKSPLRKVAAAVTIQTAFRHYRWRRNLAPHERFSQVIIRNRASLCMQAWWRSLKLTRRIKFLSTLKPYLARIDSSTIYLEETMYLELPRLIHDITQRSTRFVEQYVAFAFEPNSRQIVVRNLKVKRFESALVPQWVQNDSSRATHAQRMDSDVLSVSSGKSNHKSLPPLMEQLFVNDLMGIFHFTDGHNAPINDQSSSSKQESCDTQVKDFNQIVNYRFKSIDLQKGLKFIEIKCGTVQEARKRALLIALLTFYFKQQFFVRIFTQRQLEEGFFLQTLKDMWIAYDIDFGDIEARYHIKQFGDISYDKQVKEKQFVISEQRDRILADFLNAKSVQNNSESHVINIPSIHHQVPDRVFHLIHPKSFFMKGSDQAGHAGLHGKYTIPLDQEYNKYSTLEDGFSSRNSINAEINLSPAGRLETNANNDTSQKVVGFHFDVKMNSVGGATASGGKKKILLNKHNFENEMGSNGEGAVGKGKIAMSHQLSPIHTKGLTLLDGTKNQFDKSYLDPPKPQLTSQNFREVQESEKTGAGGGSLLQTKKKVKEYIENINQQLTETKKQEISQIRDFRQYVKLIGNELQQQQLQEFISFKREQKTLITTFLTREKDRKLFENLNKRLTAIELEHIKKRKKEDMEFSKNISAQMTMLNRVNIQSMRKKDLQKKQQAMATTIKNNMSMENSPRTTYAGARGGIGTMASPGIHMTAIRHNSQQVSPRDNKQQLKIMDLNDTFFMAAQQKQTMKEDTARARYASHVKDNGFTIQHHTDRVGPSGTAGMAMGQNMPFQSARQSIDKGEKYASLIRQYEKNHDLTDSRGRLQSQKEFMIFDESVQLPAFPKKITRNAFERSYMKRIINVKMNEFTPLNTNQGGIGPNGNNNIFGMVSQNNESFLMTNSYSQGFPQVQSRGSASGMPIQKNDLSSISPMGGPNTTLQEDSLYKPSFKDMTIMVGENSLNPVTSPSQFGISLQKTSLGQHSKGDPNATLSHADDPTTYRTGGGASTGRQYHHIPHMGHLHAGGSVHVAHVQNSPAAHLQVGTSKKLSPPVSHNIKINLSMNHGLRDSDKTLPGKNSRGQLKESSIWDYNEDHTSSRKRIVMPLKKLIS